MNSELVNSDLILVVLFVCDFVVLEVYQFSRDASVAEAWLAAHEPYVNNPDFGNTLDAVETLLKKHDAFERSAATQEERFAALERLTTVSVAEKLYLFCKLYFNPLITIL